MGERMTPAELDAAEALANAATEGPWESLPNTGPFTSWIQGSSGIAGAVGYDAVKDVWAVAGGDEVYAEPSEADAEFIAAARSLVPRLVAEVRARDTVIEAVRAIHAEKHGESARYAPDDVTHDGPIVGWEPYTMCAGCSASPYPCATIRALGAKEEEK